MAVVAKESHAAVAKAFEPIAATERILSINGVRRVLTALMHGEISADQAQTWASFMKRGYISRSKQPVRPVNIPFQKDREEVISEVITKLDELGDAIDGSLGHTDIMELLDKLSLV